MEAARLVSMTPPAGREATPLPASPSTWPSKEPSATTTQQPSFSNQDNFQLHSGSETQLSNMSQLAIVGNGSQGEVVITCQPLAGLAFFQSEDIKMRNVTVTSCGAIQNSTSRYTRTFSSPFLKIQVAIFYSDCKNVLLTGVYVKE